MTENYRGESSNSHLLKMIAIAWFAAGHRIDSPLQHWLNVFFSFFIIIVMRIDCSTALAEWFFRLWLFTFSGRCNFLTIPLDQRTHSANLERCGSQSFLQKSNVMLPFSLGCVFSIAYLTTTRLTECVAIFIPVEQTKEREKETVPKSLYVVVKHIHTNPSYFVDPV